VQIPPREECLRLLTEMQMPEHIRAHSELVCRVALLLVDGLAAAGVDLNRTLVDASAMLHDITKPRSFKTGENHSRTGGEYLTDLGYPEVGQIVRQHVIMDAYFLSDAPSEAEIVNYADKRVLHDRIVSLDNRMDYIVARYAKTAAHRQWLMQMWEQTVVLEDRLFGYLPFEPCELAERIVDDRLY
jgi:uncharacterized protein